MAALSPRVQRDLALELARAACSAADAPVDWRPAPAAIDRGHPLPPPFDRSHTAYAAVFPSAGSTVVASWTVLPRDASTPPRQPLHPASAAVGAVLAAGLADPLAALLGTVEAASWSVPDLDRWFDEVGSRVRDLSGPSC